ncbi:hypothetical protein SESBI_02398 [Sesbania bispinosa]|nr:hypothetical protein SESBI_02398 [Sesbania bispinosa]
MLVAVAVVEVMEFVAAIIGVVVAEVLAEGVEADSSFQPHDSLVLYDPSTQQPAQSPVQ